MFPKENAAHTCQIHLLFPRLILGFLSTNKVNKSRPTAAKSLAIVKKAP